MICTTNWELLQQSNEKTDKQKDWKESFVVVAEVEKKEELVYVLDKIKEQQLVNLNDLYFFRKGTKPCWEDSQNVNGGRIIFELPVEHPKIPEYCAKSFMFAFLNTFPSINGVAYNDKDRTARICLWISDGEEHKEILAVYKEVISMGFMTASYTPHRKNKEHGKMKKKGFGSGKR